MIPSTLGEHHQSHVQLEWELPLFGYDQYAGDPSLWWPCNHTSKPIKPYEVAELAPITMVIVPNKHRDDHPQLPKAPGRSPGHTHGASRMVSMRSTLLRNLRKPPDKGLHVASGAPHGGRRIGWAWNGDSVNSWFYLHNIQCSKEIVNKSLNHQKWIIWWILAITLRSLVNKSLNRMRVRKHHWCFGGFRGVSVWCPTVNRIRWFTEFGSNWVA